MFAYKDMYNYNESMCFGGFRCRALEPAVLGLSLHRPARLRHSGGLCGAAQ